MIALDTNVLVAAANERHPNHEEALTVVERIAEGELVLPVKALEETYSVLTRLPGAMRMTPSEAGTFLSSLLEVGRPVALTAAEAVELLTDAVTKGVVGGLINDAFVARAARLGSAEVLLTWNVKHLRGLEPDLAVRSPAAWLAGTGP